MSERPDSYEYPEILYCGKCGRDVESKIIRKTETMTKEGQPVEVPYHIAVCPVCGDLLCEQDLDYAIIRLAREDGLMT